MTRDGSGGSIAVIDEAGTTVDTALLPDPINTMTDCDEVATIVDTVSLLSPTKSLIVVDKTGVTIDTTISLLDAFKILAKVEEPVAVVRRDEVTVTSDCPAVMEGISCVV